MQVQLQVFEEIDVKKWRLCCVRVRVCQKMLRFFSNNYFLIKGNNLRGECLRQCLMYLRIWLFGSSFVQGVQPPKLFQPGPHPLIANGHGQVQSFSSSSLMRDPRASLSWI